MKPTLIASLATLAAAIALGACGSDDPAPTAEVLSATPDSLDPADDAADDLTITIAYRDADGDLGGGRAEIHDCRSDGLVVALPLPAIASPDAIEAGVPIEGELSLVVADVGARAADPAAPPACEDLGVAPLADGAVVFCVLLVDAAGHTGPGDCTDPISLAAPP
jgi:hypothetical protein